MPESNSAAQQRRYPLPDGQVLSAQVWGSDQQPPLIALHGWLDNAASFAMLAPLLAPHFQVVCLDLAGHGYSSHRPSGGDYAIAGYVVDMAQFMQSHFPEGAAFLGHSLGGIIASLLAAVQPEQVSRLAMIDSLGPQVTTEQAFTADLAKAVKRRIGDRRSAVPHYATLEQALAARKAGWLPLTDAAAAAIVPRNLCPCEQGWTWRTDPRLRYPSLHKFTEPQVTAALAGIQCPVMLLEAAEGLLVKAQGLFAGRYQQIPQLQRITVPGSHHCHLDGDVGAMAGLLSDFFTDL